MNNIVLSQFLGICPFLGVSKKIDTALEFDSTNEGGTSFKEFTLSLADHDEETS